MDGRRIGAGIAELSIDGPLQFSLEEWGYGTTHHVSILANRGQVSMNL